MSHILPTQICHREKYKLCVGRSSRLKCSEDDLWEQGWHHSDMCHSLHSTSILIFLYIPHHSLYPGMQWTVDIVICGPLLVLSPLLKMLLCTELFQDPRQTLALLWTLGPFIFCLSNYFVFFYFPNIKKKDFIYLFSERGEGREKEGEKPQCVVASCTPPTGDLAHNPGMCPDWESNQQPCGLQAGTQSTEPGLSNYFKYLCFLPWVYGSLWIGFRGSTNALGVTWEIVSVSTCITLEKSELSSDSQRASVTQRLRTTHVLCVSWVHRGQGSHFSTLDSPVLLHNRHS